MVNKRQIILLHSRYYTEARNELDPPPRLRAWTAQLRRKKVAVPSHSSHCVRFDRCGKVGIEPQTSHTVDGVYHYAKQPVFTNISASDRNTVSIKLASIAATHQTYRLFSTSVELGFDEFISAIRDVQLLQRSRFLSNIYDVNHQKSNWRNDKRGINNRKSTLNSKIRAEPFSEILMRVCVAETMLL